MLLSGPMLVSVKVQPNSKNPRIEEDDAGALTVYLKSPPVEGKANAELVKRLAQRFGVPKSRVRVKSGLASKNKLVEIL
jgi:uncharacterized protein (TIGR00251 family)